MILPIRCRSARQEPPRRKERGDRFTLIVQRDRDWGLEAGRYFAAASLTRCMYQREVGQRNLRRRKLMPKISCPCGFVHNLTPIPDDGWITIRDRDYDDFTDSYITMYKVSNGGPSPREGHPRHAEYYAAAGRVLQWQGRIYECPDCHRVMWQKEGQSGVLDSGARRMRLNDLREMNLMNCL